MRIHISTPRITTHVRPNLYNTVRTEDITKSTNFPSVAPALSVSDKKQDDG
jgi:hypothetical protein